MPCRFASLAYHSHGFICDDMFGFIIIFLMDFSSLWGFCGVIIMLSIMGIFKDKSQLFLFYFRVCEFYLCLQHNSTILISNKLILYNYYYLAD